MSYRWLYSARVGIFSIRSVLGEIQLPKTIVNPNSRRLNSVTKSNEVVNELFIGIKGHAVCLDKETGNEIWPTKLRCMVSVTNIYYDNKYVCSCANGHLFCLGAKTGRIKWKNPLAGLGHNHCIIAYEIPSQQASIINAADKEKSNAGSVGG